MRSVCVEGAGVFVFVCVKLDRKVKRQTEIYRESTDPINFLLLSLSLFILFFFIILPGQIKINLRRHKTAPEKIRIIKTFNEIPKSLSDRKPSHPPELLKYQRANIKQREERREFAIVREFASELLKGLGKFKNVQIISRRDIWIF